MIPLSPTPSLSSAFHLGFLLTQKAAKPTTTTTTGVAGELRRDHGVPWVAVDHHHPLFSSLLAVNSTGQPRIVGPVPESDRAQQIWSMLGEFRTSSLLQIGFSP